MSRQSFSAAFYHALQGIAAAVRRERNLKIELCVAVLALIVGAVLRLAPLEWCLIVVMITLVLSLEIVNSGLEALCNLVQQTEHPLIKHAKDAAAGAVLVAAFASVVVGLIIFAAAALRNGGGL